jgi:hypothetical protein
MKMKFSDFDIKKMKYMIAAFWLCIFGSIIPGLFDSRPCAMCLIERLVLVFLASFIWAGKWNKYIKILAKITSIIFICITVYHLLIIFEIVPTAKFCKINASFFEKALSSCNNSPLFFVFGSFILSIFIAILLYAS